MKFRVGDYVTVAEDSGSITAGLTGVVVTIITHHSSFPHTVGIDFKRKNLDFHNLNGNIKTKTGYWVMEDSLRLSKQGTLRQYFKQHEI
jgi:hypothetical protein